MNRFDNRVALITAAGNGLGRGVALRLAEEGAEVVIWDRDRRLLNESQEEAEKLGLNLHTQTLDMTDPLAIIQAVETLVAKHARIDVLVNNIGGSLHTPFHFLDQTNEHWQRVMDVNVTACVRTTREILPHMLKTGYGRIINMGSKAGRYGSLFAGANYVASKGAMQALTLQLAQEFGPSGITCNSVCPGAIMTERVRGFLAERQTSEERERVLLSIPVRRHGEIEDIAAAIAYLASEEAGFVTGVSLDVNGGQAMSI
jgi:NAD(P)-dependent dehydrogenase (short-subunit alcohol dehydrogenase family)